MSDGEGFEIPVGFADDVSFVVPIVHFDVRTLDSPEDYARQLVLSNKPILPFVSALVKRTVERERAAAVMRMLIEIVDAKADAGRIAWAIAVACGMTLTMGMTMAEVAVMLDVERQAFAQLVVRVGERMSLPIPPAVRDECAREAMAKSYAKRAQNPIKAICKKK